MLKIYCNICKTEIQDPEFLFEGAIMETFTGFDVTKQNLNPQKQTKRQVVHICRECYDKHILKLLNERIKGNKQS